MSSPNPQIEELPENIQALTLWIKSYRPEILPQWETILEGDRQGVERRFQSMLALALIGFEAGRSYGRSFPEKKRPDNWDSRHLRDEHA